MWVHLTIPLIDWQILFWPKVGVVCVTVNGSILSLQKVQAIKFIAGHYFSHCLFCFSHTLRKLKHFKWKRKWPLGHLRSDLASFLLARPSSFFVRQCLASTSLKVSCSLSVFFDMDFLFLLLSRLPIMEVLLVSKIVVP